MRQKLTVLVLTAFLTLGFAGLATAGQVVLKVNSKQVSTDVAPIIKSGRTLVPVRTISESLGADVTWNAGLRQVTIVKNTQTIVLTIDKKSVYVNGVKKPNLDVPVGITNGRTMVPIRFISETIGAKVGWDAKTSTVSVDMNELRDGLTPEQLVMQSSQAMEAINSYQFNGNGSFTLSSPDLPGDMKMGLAMTGSYKRTGTVTEVYESGTIKIPAYFGDPAQTSTYESYTNGQRTFSRENGSPWEEGLMGTDPSEYMESQNPQQLTSMAKVYALILSHGNIARINGKEYYTVVAKVDPAKLLQAIATNRNGQDPGADISDLTSDLNLNITEKIYIDKQTMLVNRVEIMGSIVLNIGSSPLREDVNMVVNLADYDGAVDMPVIPGI